MRKAASILWHEHFILPVFGMNQTFLLLGNLHWIIQTAHMLVGIGALALAGIAAMRYRRVKKGEKSGAVAI